MVWGFSGLCMTVSVLWLISAGETAELLNDVCEEGREVYTCKHFAPHNFYIGAFQENNALMTKETA